MSDLVKIAALWVNESKDGTKYMSGYLGDARLVVFRNNYKEEEKHPDFIVYVSPNEKKNGGSGKGQSEDGGDLPF